MTAALLVALVALIVVGAVAWPLVRERREGVEHWPADEARLELHEQIEQSLRAIREIEFDHRAGNLSDSDFAELRDAERSRTAELLRRRDLHQG